MDKTDTPRLTPWFPGHIKPVRKGVYMQMDGSGTHVGYQYWDGTHWYTWFLSAEIAAQGASRVYDSYQNDNWRGILK
jgi:hypothetical protein